MTTRLDDTAPAVLYDDSLRWIIPSDSDPHASYVVELHSPPGYSVCQCPHFQCRLEPLLARGMTPAEAVARGLVKPAHKQRTEDALKCKHILDAEKRLALAVIRSLEHAKNHQPPTR